MKNNFLINRILIFVISFACFSCSKDEGTPVINSEVVAKDEISSIDEQLLLQIKKVSNILDKGEIWKKYTLTNRALFLLHKNESGKVDRGIIINPQTELKGAIKITDDSNKGLKAYRYDAGAKDAFDFIESDSGNGLYELDLKLDGKSYYTQVYTDKEVLAGDKLAEYPGGFFDINKITIGSIDFIIHENFHNFQDEDIATKISNKSTSNETISKEILELRTLMHQIFKNFPDTSMSNAMLEEKLKQYVAIRAKQIELSSNINFTETNEGTARYVEKMALRSAFPERALEPFITGTVLENDFGISNQQILNQLFSFQLSYEIGASACYAISKINKKALEDVNRAKPIYEVAKDLFKMDKVKLEEQLNNAKKANNWNAIKQKVITWQKLK